MSVCRLLVLFNESVNEENGNYFRFQEDTLVFFTYPAGAGKQRWLHKEETVEEEISSVCCASIMQSKPH